MRRNLASDVLIGNLGVLSDRLTKNSTVRKPELVKKPVPILTLFEREKRLASFA